MVKKELVKEGGRGKEGDWDNRTGGKGSRKASMQERIFKNSFPGFTYFKKTTKQYCTLTSFIAKVLENRMAQAAPEWLQMLNCMAISWGVLKAEWKKKLGKIKIFSQRWRKRKDRRKAVNNCQIITELI